MPSPPRSAVLALDVGDVRIGVAVSESGVIATPLAPIERSGRRAVLDALEQLVAKYRASCIVVGIPLLEGGAEGAQVEKTRAFVRSLQRRIPKVRISEWDERYTSGEAREILERNRGGTGSVDSVAAAILLQEYLDEQSRERGP